MTLDAKVLKHFSVPPAIIGISATLITGYGLNMTSLSAFYATWFTFCLMLMWIST